MFGAGRACILGPDGPADCHSSGKWTCDAQAPRPASLPARGASFNRFSLCLCVVPSKNCRPATKVHPNQQDDVRQDAPSAKQHVRNELWLCSLFFLNLWHCDTLTLNLKLGCSTRSLECLRLRARAQPPPSRRDGFRGDSLTNSLPLRDGLRV